MIAPLVLDRDGLVTSWFTHWSCTEALAAILPDCYGNGIQVGKGRVVSYHCDYGYWQRQGLTLYPASIDPAFRPFLTSGPNMVDLINQGELLCISRT